MRLPQRPLGAALSGSGAAAAAAAAAGVSPQLAPSAVRCPLGSRASHAAALKSCCGPSAAQTSFAASSEHAQEAAETRGAAVKNARPARRPLVRTPAMTTAEAPAAQARQHPNVDAKVDPRLAFLVQHNTAADDLIRMCTYDRQLYRTTPRKLQVALLTFGRAESRSHAVLARMRSNSREPSSSRVTLQMLAQRESAVAEDLVAKLKKRLTALIYRFCDSRRDADINAYAPPILDASNAAGFRDVRLYNTMLNLSLGYLDDVRLFRNVMFALKRRQIPPNNHTLTILLQHAARRKDRSLAAAVVQLGLELADHSTRNHAIAWRSWRQSDPDSTPDPSSFGDAWSHEAGRTVKARLCKHPILRLLTYSIRCDDSHLMLALVEISDTFESAAQTANPALGQRRLPFWTPWPQIRMSTLLYYLYPFLRRPQPSRVALVKRARIKSRFHSRLDISHHPDWGRRTAELAALPQHTPIVLTAALTALVHEGRFGLVHRLWAWIKALSSLSAQRSDPRRESLPVTSDGQQGPLRNDTWQIPVRAATIYFRAVTTLLRRDAKVERRPPSPRLRQRAISDALSVGGASPHLQSHAKGVQAARDRAEDARHALVRSYLFLRHHWRLDDPAFQRQAHAANAARFLPPPSAKKDPHWFKEHARHQQKQRQQQPQATAPVSTTREVPDSYFYAVLLNSLVPRDDGPLDFVDCRMVMRRVRKRYPDLVQPASAWSIPSQTSSAAQDRPQDIIGRRRRRHVAGLLGQGKTELRETIQLVLSDMKAVGIETHR